MLAVGNMLRLLRCSPRLRCEAAKAENKSYSKPPPATRPPAMLPACGPHVLACSATSTCIVDTSDCLSRQVRCGNLLYRTNVCSRSIQLAVRDCEEQVHCKQWCFFSPPSFPPLAIVIEQSGFVWRRCLFDYQFQAPCCS